MGHVYFQVPHEVITFIVDAVSGQSSVPVQVFVAGQESSVFTMPVQSPVIDAVDVYDTGLLVCRCYGRATRRVGLLFGMWFSCRV
jgi:hypothetical protein